MVVRLHACLGFGMGHANIIHFVAEWRWARLSIRRSAARNRVAALHSVTEQSVIAQEVVWNVDATGRRVAAIDCAAYRVAAKRVVGYMLASPLYAPIRGAGDAVFALAVSGA